MKLDALFFSAHPDDVELSCGGTVAKLVKLGKKVGIADITRGELSTRGSASLREKETKNASKVLGISKRINIGIPDGDIQNTSINRIKVIKIIRDFRPEIIFSPHYHDRHPDHFHTHELVKEAAFYAGLKKIKTKLNGRQQNAFRPRKNFYYMQTYVFEPNIITDVSDVHSIKMKAISCYKSQFYNPNSKEPATFISDPGFIKFIETRALFYGFLAGAEFGEPFFSEEKVKINPKDLFGI